MKSAILIRSGSFQNPCRLLIRSDNSGSSAVSLRRCRSVSMSPRSAVYAEVKPKLESTMRRARSEADLIVSNSPTTMRWQPATVQEEHEENLDREVSRGSAAAIGVEEEVELSGGGRGKGIKIGGGGGGGGGDHNEEQKMKNYFREMLRSDPSNSLLLRNYGKFLQEVEGDAKGAEECYGRAILASPRDGDLLSLYGKLVWETHKDQERAEAYFERAVDASPDDCYVLGSYASFLWDAEEDDEEVTKPSPPLVRAF